MVNHEFPCDVPEVLARTEKAKLLPLPAGDQYLSVYNLSMLPSILYTLSWLQATIIIPVNQEIGNYLYAWLFKCIKDNIKCNVIHYITNLNF